MQSNIQQYYPSFYTFYESHFFPGQTPVPPRSGTWILDLSHDPIWAIWLAEVRKFHQHHDRIVVPKRGEKIRLTYQSQNVIELSLSDGTEIIVSFMMTSSNGNIFRVGDHRSSVDFYPKRDVSANNRGAGDLRRHRAHYDDVYVQSIKRQSCNIHVMMTSSNGSIFCVTGHLCGKFTGHRWILRAKARDVEL